MQWTLVTRDTINGGAIYECPACYGNVTDADMPEATIEGIVEDAVIGDHGCDRCDNTLRPDDAVAAAEYARVIAPHPDSVLTNNAH